MLPVQQSTLKMSARRLVRGALLSLASCAVLGLAAGCGQKGPLYLPAPASSAPAPSPTSSSPAS